MSSPIPFSWVDRSTPVAERFSRLYRLAQTSRHVFGSPLGPFTSGGQLYPLPRFFSCGPDSSDASVRLAFLTGYDGSDPRLTEGLLAFVEQLVGEPALGQSLHLSFFPLVNPTGFAAGTCFNAAGVDLRREAWDRSTQPEIQLLQRDARTYAYHGYVQLRSAPVSRPTGLLRWPDPASSGGGADLVASGTEPLPLDWATAPAARIDEGPLTIADDLPFRPFELILGIPSSWTAAEHCAHLPPLLRGFVQRYQTTLSFGQFL